MLLGRVLTSLSACKQKLHLADLHKQTDQPGRPSSANFNLKRQTGTVEEPTYRSTHKNTKKEPFFPSYSIF